MLFDEYCTGLESEKAMQWALIMGGRRTRSYLIQGLLALMSPSFMKRA